MRPLEVEQRLPFVLGELVFPAMRWEILAVAELYGADQATLGMLHRLTENRFDNIEQIVQNLRQASP